jgi:hypothetical protein
VFLGGVSFFIGCLLSPLRFLGVPRFHRRSFELIAFLGVYLFSPEVFLSLLHFLGAPLLFLEVF